MRAPSADQLTVSQRAGHRTTSTAPGAVTLLTKMLCLPSIDATYAMLRPSGDQIGCASPCPSVANGRSSRLAGCADPLDPAYMARAASPPATATSSAASHRKDLRDDAAPVTGAAAVPPVTFLSANARSDADWKRSVGWLFRQRWTIVRRLAGMDSTSGGGSARKTALITSAVVAPSNGRAPDNISYSTMPRLKISERASSASPRTCSGDM